MKIRLTIMTENDVPVEALGENGLEKARGMWEILIALLSLQAKPNESISLEKVELVDESDGGADG